MLTIKSLLKNVYCCIRNISKKSYRDCAIIVSGFLVFAMISLNAQAFGGSGKNKTVPKESSGMRGTEEPQEDTEEKEIFTGAEFIVTCRQALDTEQSKIEQQSKAEKQKREVVKVCASLEEIRQISVELPPEPVNPYDSINELSGRDYESLCRIVQAEAGGEDEMGKILVAEVILNRVLATGFPDNVYDVVFERSGGSAQFSPTADGRYFTVKVTSETEAAVEKALHGEDNSQGALFFSARSKANSNDMAWFDRNLKWLFQHGGHEFYTLP